MIAEDYIARGVWPRHSELRPWDGSGEYRSAIHRPEGDGVIGHMPFFASAEEAAGAKQWITVAALPMDDKQIIYLDSGWVDGMLALRFVDEALPMGNYDDVSSVWGYTLAPMGSKLDVLSGGSGRANYHGAVGLLILEWAPYAAYGASYDIPHREMSHRLYVGIKALTVFFEVEENVSVIAPWRQYADSCDWDNDNRTPFCRIPDLRGCLSSRYGLNGFFIPGNTRPWPDDLFDASQGVTLGNIRSLWELVMLYDNMAARDRALPHSTKNVASCTTALLPYNDALRWRWLTIDVYNFEHCEHVYGLYQYFLVGS